MAKTFPLPSMRGHSTLNQRAMMSVACSGIDGAAMSRLTSSVFVSRAGSSSVSDRSP